MNQSIIVCFSVYNIFTVWAPAQEKVTLMSISFAGWLRAKMKKKNN